MAPLLLCLFCGLGPFCDMPSLQEGDWPQFLGPLRTGEYTGKDLAEAWPPDGPRILWRKAAGEGFSGPVEAGGRVYLFHRLGDREVVDCLDAETGKSIWSSGYPTAYEDSFGFSNGPRATPAIENGRIFTFGAGGTLRAAKLSDGAETWSVDVKERFKADQGYFGFACSPLVEGNMVLINAGGAGAGIIAFDKESGKVLWTATDHEASYSSPAAAMLDGQRHIFFFTREGLVDLLAETGDVQFDFHWRARIKASVNAATPLIIGDRIFISSSYQTGAALIKVRGKTPEKVWSGDESISSHYSTCVHRDGFLYGYDGRQESSPSLRCIELDTGKVRWSEDRFGAGTVLLAGDRLILLREEGGLVVAAASPEKYKRLLEAKLLPGTVRAYPALARGRLYVRNEQELAAVDLRAGK